MASRRGGVPDVRVRAVKDIPVRPEGQYVLYWMVATRRLHHNFGLQRAVEWSCRLGKPLVVLEGPAVRLPLGE